MEKKRKAEDKRKRRNDRKAEQLLPSTTVGEGILDSDEDSDADVTDSIEAVTEGD